MKCSISRSDLRALLIAGVIASFAAPSFAAPSAADSKRAADVAVKAGQAYRAGSFQEAADLFLEAYKLSERPAQLRNAAKALQEGGMLDEAAVHWARYKDHAGISADERAEAEANLRLIVEKKKNTEIVQRAEAASKAAENASASAEAVRKHMEVTEAARLEQAAASALVAPAPPPPTSTVPKLAMIGGGAAAAITGTILWFVSSGQLDDLDAKIATRDGDGRITGTTPTEVTDEVSSINTKRVLSGVLFSAGLAVAAGGVAWLVFDEESVEPGGPRIAAF